MTNILENNLLSNLYDEQLIETNGGSEWKVDIVINNPRSALAWMISGALAGGPNGFVAGYVGAVINGDITFKPRS